MKFDAVKMLHSKGNIEAVLEANTTHTVDIEGQSMNVAIITDEMIEDNNLKPVTNAVWFKSGSEPTDDGLFSPEIFGDVPKKRMKTHAYIDLRRKYFHPYVYEIIIKLNKKIDNVASGQGAWIITDDGDLERITDVNDTRYNEDNTGLDWLINNFNKLKFKETGSAKRDKQLSLLNSLSEKEIFITKWIVIPIFYRDYDSSSGMKSIPDIDYAYNDIITSVNAYDNEILSISQHLTLYRIQKKLVDIRNFGQSLIEKKKGAFQKSVLGKSTDYGSRGVISVPPLNNCELPDDTMIDIIHSGIPLSLCCTMGYPFVIKWVMEYFEDLFRNRNHIPVYTKDANGEPKLEYAEIQDMTEVFTKEFIDKKIKMYVKSYSAERFETVKVTLKDGREVDLYFPGKGYTKDPDNVGANTIGSRPLTWTDVFYLAAEETLSSKYCYITRYPLEDYFGTFPSKVAVLSTIKTTPIIINGKVYPHYPLIDLSLSRNQIATQFIDTISISNLYLDAIGGDYDGDTVSVKICFSIEANEEAEEALNDIKHYMSTQGNIVRILGNETYLTFYNMTRRE